MPSERTSFRTTFARALRQALPWVLALAVATCTDDQNGPSKGGTGYFAFRPVYGISGTLSQFGIVADSVHIKLTRPVNQLVLDTTVFFPADSSKLRLALPINLEVSPETLTAVIGISAGPTLLFTDSVDVQVVDGPPSVANIPTVILTYVGPGKNVAAITLLPGDTTIVLKDTLFFSATAVDSSAAPVSSFFVGWKTSDTTVAKINGAGRLIAPNLRGSVQVIGSTPTGIADTTNVTFAPVPVIIARDSGNAQTGLAGDSLGALFVARVKASDSLGVAGVKVRWVAVTAGGAVRDTLLTTDANGRVSTRGVFGDTARVYSYTATVVGTALTTTFTSTATAGAPTAIALGVGNNQVDSAGRPLGNGLSVKVTDAFGNPTSGAVVTWSRLSGGGTLFSDTNTTDVTGTAVNIYTLGAVGTDSIRVALSGTSAFVTFVEIAINGAPATATKVFGDTQTAVVGQLLTDSLAVVVKSATNFPVIGTPVVWTVLRGSVAAPDTVLTDVNGRAAFRYTLGTVSGTDSVLAQAAAISATFTATAQAAAPSAIVIFSGNTQVDTANRALPQSLVVAVTDAFGNAVLGTPVTFTRIAGHGHVGADTVTAFANNHPGTAYTFGTIPGVDSIRATLLANGATATFAETSINATPASVIETHGNGIATTVGTAFGDSLIVQILDINDAPIALEPVIWTVTSGSGAVTLDTVLTDSLGFAVQHVTAGSTAGVLVINAKVVTPIAPVNFALTTNAGAASGIAITSGDAQVDTAGLRLPLPLAVHVTDAFGNAVAATTVAYTRISGNGTVDSSVIVTDASGDAAMGYTLGALPGLDTVRAQLIPSGALVFFTNTTIPASPASIAATTGDGQTDSVGSALGTTLVATVLSGASTPIAGTGVVWSVIRGGSLDVDTVFTDPLGQVSAHYTLGTASGTDTVRATTLTGGHTVDFTFTATTGAAATIGLVSGNAQTDTTGRILALPLQVHIADAHNNPVAGAKVAWTTVSGTGHPNNDTTLTDIAGNSQVAYTLGATPALDSIRAALVGTSAFVPFTATSISGAPAGISKIFGDAQVDTVLSTLTDSLIVQLKDGGGTPIPNTWLYWQTAGITLSADSTKTDVNGKAAVRATFGSAAATFPVVVRNFDTTVATVFLETAHPGAPTQLTKLVGDAQTGTVNTPLPINFTVLVRDAHGNLALAGTSVTWTNLAGFTPAGLPDTTITDTLGIATLLNPLPGPLAGQDSLIAKILGGTAADTFTVTATSGAASHLVYVSGTGQTDTVSALLAAPLVVQARDASSNPVAGVYVHFTRISGTGIVLSDSALTNGAGAAQTLYSMGILAGRDSILATLAGSSDTVPFYNVSTPGAPKTLTKISGDSQSVAVSSALPAPFVVRITDQFGNPIQGPSVSFDTVGTGASILGFPVATDASGLATTGTVTLGATAGTFSFPATTSSIPGDTVFFTAVALPIGTSKQWLGTLSSNWGTAGNWSPAVVPSAADNVFIPAAAPNEPILDASHTIGGLQVESGASVTLNAFNLTLNGNTQIDGSMSRTSGLTILAAAAGTAQGALTGVRVTGNITLSGTTTVADSLQLTSGSLVVNGHTLTINGAFSDNGSGALTMTNAADSVTVTGATLFNGSTAAGLLSAGTLVLDGPFSEPSGSAVFQGSGTHTTVFNGGTNQTVTFASASLAGNRLQNVVFANASGITLGGNIAAAGTVSVTAGVVTGAGRTGLLGGDLSDPTSLGWNVATTSLAGTPTLLPDTILGNLDITGTVTLAKPMVVKGNLTPNGVSVLALNGFGMRVDGGMTVSGGAQVKMLSATDSLDVAGAISYNGSTTAGLLTAGTFVVRGNFSEPSGSAVFQGSGSHKTVFAGSAAQTVSFGSASIAGNRFADVEFANPAGVTLTSNAAAAGNGSVTAGVVTGSLGTTSITMGGNVTDASSTSWQVPITVLAGTPASLPDSFPAGVTVTGTVTLAKALVIKGAYAQTGGTLTLNGFRLRADSSFNDNGSGQVVMHNAGDTLDIAGTATWNGSTTTGVLTAGTTIFRGNFSEPSGSIEFQATGTHTTIFAGTAAQTVAFGAQSLAGNHFQDLVIANASGVNFANGGSVAGNALISGGVVTSSANQILTVNGDLTDATNVSWRPEITSLTGTPSILPDSFARNVTISGNVQLSHSIAFKANLTGTAGVIIPAGFHIRVDSAFTLNGSGQVKMQNGADTLDIAGATSWNGSTVTGLMTAGTIIFRGDFSEPSGSIVFQATGSHSTVFAGTAAQTVSFGAQSLAGNHFQDLVIANTAGVNFASGGSVAGNASIAGGVITSSANQILTVNGNLTDATNVSWRPEITSLTGTPSIVPDSFTRNVTVSGSLNLPHSIAFKANLTSTAGVIAPSGFHLRVDSAFTLSGSGQFKMQNGADTLDVAGVTSWNGSTVTGLLTAGTIILRGDFSEPSGSIVFQATGSHATVFAGTAAQTVTFGAQSLAGNHFQDLVIANAAGVNFASGGSVAGNASIAGGVITSSANQTLTVNGNITDATGISWRPEITSLTGTPASLPDSFVRNVTVSGTVTLPHPLAIQAKLTQTAGAIDINGFKLRVDSALTLNGGQFLMQNAADSVNVGGTATWNGSTTPGLLTAGALILHGDFSEPSGSSVFQPSGTHTTVFKDSVTHTVTFAVPSVGGNRFNDLRLEGPTALALGNNLVVNGSIVAPLGLPVTIGSTAGVRSVATRGLTVNQVTFDSVRVSYSGAPIAFLQNVTFQHQDPTAVQFAISEAGSATPEGLQNVQFLTTPTSGKYVSATDTLANGIPLVVQMYHSFPLDGTPFEQQVGGGDGATIDWSTFKFLIQPLDAGVLGILDTVQVYVRAPDGNPDANFTGNVALTIGTNPGSATLGGTTTVAAVLGVAKFGDLTLSAAGFGYTLDATTPGIASATSNTFNITVPLPAGFTNQWFGTTSTDWYTATNWSAGTIPDSTTNVFISGAGVNAPTIGTDSAFVNRLRLAPGAKMTVDGVAKLVADSSVELGAGRLGAGTLELRGTGTFTGPDSGSQTQVTGTYSIAGTASAWDLEIFGDLTVAADTLNVGFQLQTQAGGTFNMTDPATLVYVAVEAAFDPNTTTSGNMVDGTLRIGGNIISYGGGPKGFTPSGNQVTEFVGTGDHLADFYTPDSLNGSHFANVKVNGTGKVTFSKRIPALGQIQILQGTLQDSLGQGLVAHQGLSVATGASLAMGGELRSGGPITVAVGGTYSVPTTTYFGAGAPFAIDAIPYDTLQIERAVQVGADFAVPGDLRINSSGADAARFDLKGHTVTVTGSVNVNGDGAVVEQNGADVLNVAGDFFTNGATTEGLLTAGVLQIGGNFRQAADYSGAAFRASPAHLTRFTGGAGHRSIKFDSPASDASDSTNSKFGAVDLADGVDSLSNNGVLTDRLTLGGSVEFDTAFGGNLTALDSVIVLASAGTLHLSQLNLWNGIAVAAGPTYNVGNTEFFGGTTLPALTYNDVLISGTTLTMNSNVTATGNVGIGQNGEVGGTAGDLIVNGHVLHVGGQFATGGFGVVTMATGDSVDVGSDINFNGGNTSGHLTGGTLVGRGNFSASSHSGDSTFVAGKSFRTVLADTVASTIYVNAQTESGMQFGKLILLDAAPRAISTFGSRMIVQDSLVLGNAAGSLGTARTGYVLAKGPVFTVGGSGINVNGFEADSTLLVSGTYSVTTTTFGGQAQLIPALTYDDIIVTGTASLADSLVIPGNTLSIDGQTGPADLALAGHRLVAGTLLTSEQGTLTMTNAADTADVRASTVFNGGNETGRITAGVFLFHGAFAQLNTASDSSFVATGTNETRFTDSSAVVAVNTTTMNDGRSRFNDVVITGSGAGTGVTFGQPVWIGGNAGIASPTISPVAGIIATLGGDLNDPTHLWAVDTTVFKKVNAFFPDTMLQNVSLTTNTLTASHYINGSLDVAGSVVLNSHTLHTGGDLNTTGTGRLLMTQALDTVQVDGLANFAGGTEVGFLTNGHLILTGGGLSRDASPNSFDATGSHVTVFAGSSGQAFDFPGGPQGMGFNDVVSLNPAIAFHYGVMVHGTFRDSVTGSTAVIDGFDSTFIANRVELTDVQLNNAPLIVGDSSQVDSVQFGYTDPEGKVQLTITGAGRTTPLDLHTLTFGNLPTSGKLLQVTDTLADADSLIVRVFGSTPFDGSTLTALTGTSAAQWSHLALTGLLPAVIDSAIPFGFSVQVTEPDGAPRADVNAQVDLSMSANPGNAVLTPATPSANFDGSSASFFGLQLVGNSAGASFHLQVQGRAIDSINTAPFDVINPAPAGAIVFDGGAADGLWSSALNWSTDIVPTGSDSVFIPGGTSVTFDKNVDTVGTLVLGTGASLNIAPGDSLYALGRVAAGNTIAGSGTLVLAGGAQQVSGFLPATLVKGSVSAVGRIQVAGDLVIDGTGAEFNVGGERVDVSNAVITSNGGLLTMDGAADSVFAANADFTGGDETGRLSDGVLVLQGSGMNEGGGDPNAFHTSGNFTVLFANSGSSAFSFINDPTTSHFRHVKVQNPAGVDLSGSSSDDVFIDGDLTVSAGGVVAGPQVHIVGNVQSFASNDSIGFGTLKIDGSLTVGGGYGVINTEFVGAGQVIDSLPYQTIIIAGTGTTLGGNVTSGNVYASSELTLAGHTLHTMTFWTQDTGRLIMTSAIDSLIADTSADFHGASQKGFLDLGVVALGGNLAARGDRYQADPGHLTRFFGPTPHLINMGLSCEGSCPQPPIEFGKLQIDTGTVSILDSNHDGIQVWDTLRLNSGQLFDQSSTVLANGPVVADAPSYFKVATLDLQGDVAIAVDDTAYQVSNTVYSGLGQIVTPLPYQTLTFAGSSTNLQAKTAAWYVNLVGQGELTMAGHTLVADSQFTSDSASHLYMQDALDSLIAPTSAVFKSENTTGDFTAGVILARHFIQMPGVTGGQLSFVQSDSNRLVPMAGDTIEMQSAGPAASYLKSIDFSSANGAVTVRGLWVTDTAWVTNPATVVNADTGFTFYVADHFIQTAGAFNVPRFAIAGTLDWQAGSYVVDTTVFAGNGQSIFNNVPYANIVVQYGAALAGGNLDLRTGGHSLIVQNSGDLDLSGHTLQTVEFRTEGYGRLSMHSSSDSLVATFASFFGDSTNLSLTNGTIVTQYLDQQVGSSGSNKSYAPSGTHRLVLADLGSAGDGVGVNFQTPGFDSSHANVLVDSSYGMIVGSPIVVNDSLLLNVPVNSAPNLSITAYGPVFFGSGVIIGLDTLVVHDTLVVDPAATYNVNNTVFAPSAAPLAGAVTYHNVIIEGAQTLTDTLAAAGSITLRGGGTLTPTGHKVTAGGGLDLVESAHLVMVAGDTVDVGSASFDGAASTTDLAGGVLRIRNGLSSGSSTNSQTFVPTGMVTEFYGGSTANVAFTSAPQSYINALRVIGGTTLAPTTYFLVKGPAVFQDGSTFNGNSAPAALDFRGTVTVLDTSAFVSVNTVFFADSLTMATPNYYSVASTRFDGTAGIPDLPYQGLIIDSVQTTLTHRIAASGQLQIIGGTAGATKITLGGFALSAGTLDISGYARVEMTDPNDSLVSAGTMTFAGEDESGLLTAGYLRVAGDLHQNGYYSSKNLRTDGVRVEFYGPSNHELSFDNPDTSLSYIGNVGILSGGNLYLNSASAFRGRVDVGTSSKLDLSTLPSAGAADFYGPVTLASGASLIDNNIAQASFHDTLLVDPSATYNVLNTAFYDVDTIPNVAYQNLLLSDGTHITLAENISTTGALSLNATTPGGQDLTLNGHSMNVAGNFQTQLNGRVTMTTAGDVLSVGQGAYFWGGDEAGRLTAGGILVGGGFSQQAAQSDRSFRSTGTSVQFPFSGPQHQVSFATPDSSYFTDVTSVSTNPLSLNITGRMKATGTVGGYSTNITGDTLEVGTLSAGPGSGSVTLLHLVAGQIIGSFGSFVAPVTTIFGNGAIPALAYDTLILAGRDSVTIGAVTANQIIVQDSAYIGTGALLQSAGDLVIDGAGAVLKNDGGLLSVDGTLGTSNGGVLMSQNVANTMSTKHAVWNGGNEIGLLTAGTLSVNGDFSILTGGPTFRADSLFVVNFTGGQAHDLNIGIIGPVQYFGELGIHSANDTLNFTFAGDLDVYKLSATGGAVINSSLNGIQAEQLAVNGAVFNEMPIHVFTTSDQPEAFDNVTFTGFSANDIQMFFEHPSHAGAFTFNGIDFDNVTVSPSGYFLLTNRTDANGSFTINMGSPSDYLSGILHTLLGTPGGSTIVNWAAGF